MSREGQIAELLKSHGAVLARTKKHNVWKLKDGRSWTTPKTPSCSRSAENNYHDLLKFLGVKAERRKRAGERRAKQGTAKAALQLEPLPPVRDWRETLKQISVAPKFNEPICGLKRTFKKPLHVIMERVFG